MCLLTFYPAGVLPDTAALFNGAIVNTDGHGYAIVTGDRIKVRHGLNAEDVIAAFDADRRVYPDGPALFHSRFATHGDTGTGNCHPFTVGGDERTVLAHNGVLPKLVQPARADRRSDTRILAEDFLPVLGSLRVRRNRLRLQDWMTTANKIVILTVDRSFKQRAYILNENAGIWDGGIWYSNEGYLPARVRYAQGWDCQYDDDAGATWLCVSCGAARPLGDLCCQICGYCPDCGEGPGDCQCYMPISGQALGSPTYGSVLGR